MWWMMAAQAGMAVASQAMQHSASSEQSKIDKKVAKYQEKMQALTAALAQNDVTTNLTQTMITSGENALIIQKNRIKAAGARAAEDAAAGVKGGSVNATMRDIMRNSAQAEYFRQRDLRGSFMQADATRRGIAMDAKLSKRVGTIGKPSMAADILNVANTGLKLYKDYDQEGYFD